MLKLRETHVSLLINYNIEAGYISTSYSYSRWINEFKRKTESTLQLFLLLNCFNSANKLILLGCSGYHKLSLNASFLLKERDDILKFVPVKKGVI